MTCHFVPPYLLRQVAHSGVGSSDTCAVTLRTDEGFRASRETHLSGPGLTTQPPALVPPALGATAAWTVHDAEGGTRLPGVAVRSAGEPSTGDVSVDEAADGIESTLRLFAEAFGRSSFDGAGAPVLLTVHYRENYVNAFWDGTQLVFGDGDGEVFERFTKPVDVLGHEFGHAVTDRSAGLVYRDQSGALNESVSDVFAACLSQWLGDQEVGQATWLIGEGLFLPGIRARALRDMAAPGTAYDDPVLGRDPQVGHMDHYIETTDDNGGVHLNSGIPNKAFHLAATAIGGRVWEGAGRVWYAALTGGAVGPDTDFGGFAAATVDAARAVLSEDAAGLVARAWQDVGVHAVAAGSQPPATHPTTRSGQVCVRRSGGFAGLVTTGEVDLGADDPRVSEVRVLLEAVDLETTRVGSPMPDMFVYTFELPGQAPRAVPEQALTPELRRLAELVLRDARRGETS